MANYVHIEKRFDILDAALKAFYIEMNQLAVAMKLKDTQFSSAHGMHHDHNYSSAQDIAILSYHAMKDSTFRQIVKT